MTTSRTSPALLRKSKSQVYTAVLVMFMGLMLLHQTQTTLAAYVLNDNFQGPSFWDNFWFWNQADPAGGYVSYQARQEAANQNLIQVSENNTVIIAVDTTNIAGAAGRNAVRLQSNKNWNSGLFVLDFVHMPTGCGTWPAWWFNGPNPWPTGGEVDVIEGVNTQTATQSTLHTTQGCTMPIAHQNVFSGDWVSGTNGQPANDCFIDAPTQWANQGCGVLGPANGYGAPSNAGRGGVYAMEWTSEYFQMFYFPRNRIPADLTSNAPIPTNWGLPYARFPLSASCPANKFQNLNMILNTDFCGGWAGGLFAQTCPGLGGDCNAYVKNNPCAFTQAYWEINYIRVFQQNNVAGPSRSPQPVPSVPPTRSKAPNACTP